VLIIGMTCVLRWIDVKYLRPKRIAAAEEIRGATVGGASRNSDVTLSQEAGEASIKGIDEAAVVVKSV
jgi:hypothetical protein